jgi:hypothetical protein
MVGGMFASALLIVSESLHDLFARPPALRESLKNIDA